MRSVVVLIGLAGAACSEADESSPSAEADGGPKAPVAVELRAGYFTYEGEPLKPLEPGGVLPVRLASQGGYAAFVGARVTGLGPGPVGMAAELTDPATGALLVADARTVRLDPAADGAPGVEPSGEDAADFLHLVACPNYGKRMVHGLEWKLTLRMDDPRWTGETAIVVVPTCAAGSRYLRCVCECEPDYFFAKCGAPH